MISLEREAAQQFDRIDAAIIATGPADPQRVARLVRLRQRSRARWFRRAGCPAIARDIMRGIPYAPPAAVRRPVRRVATQRPLYVA